jgi:hypothetical protein
MVGGTHNLIPPKGSIPCIAERGRQSVRYANAGEKELGMKLGCPVKESTLTNQLE